MPTLEDGFSAQQLAAAARFADRVAERIGNLNALGRDGGFAQVNPPERLARRLDRLTRYYKGELLPATPQQVPSAAPTEVIDAALERAGAPEHDEEPSPLIKSPAAKIAVAVDAALEAMAGAGVEEDGPSAAAPERAGVVLEKIIGSTDFLDIRYLEAGVAAARAVCRIDIRDALGRVVGYGTGSLVSPRLLLTNHHVLPDAEVARRSGAEFNYQDGLDGQPLQAAMFGLDPDAFFVADAERDFSLVAVAAGEQALSLFGLNPLIEAEGKALVESSSPSSSIRRAGRSRSRSARTASSTGSSSSSTTRRTPSRDRQGHRSSTTSGRSSLFITRAWWTSGAGSPAVT